MAAKVGLFSLLNPTIKLPISPHNFHTPNTMRRQHFSVSANLGYNRFPYTLILYLPPFILKIDVILAAICIGTMIVGGGGEGEVKKGGKKKFITKEEEPEQYWQTAGEREGENPMKTPLPYIIIFGMSTPFVILAIAFANGWIKVPVR